jgi:hypothetical protein
MDAVLGALDCGLIVLECAWGRHLITALKWTVFFCVAIATMLVFAVFSKPHQSNIPLNTQYQFNLP